MTVDGAVKGDEMFPAVSSDYQQIAVLHVDDSYDRSAFLKVVSIDGRNVVERFELVLADERSKALNANDRDIAVIATVRKRKIRRLECRGAMRGNPGAFGYLDQERAVGITG